MDGLDALLATVQMPSGFPVATVALNGAKNAAYLAVAIPILADDELARSDDSFRADTVPRLPRRTPPLPPCSIWSLPPKGKPKTGTHTNYIIL